MKTCSGDVSLGSALSYQLKSFNNNLNVKDSPDLPQHQLISPKCQLGGRSKFFTRKGQSLGKKKRSG